MEINRSHMQKVPQGVKRQEIEPMTNQLPDKLAAAIRRAILDSDFKECNGCADVFSDSEADWLVSEITPAIQSALETATGEALRSVSDHIPYVNLTGIACRCGWSFDKGFDSGEFNEEWKQHILSASPATIRKQAEIRELEVRLDQVNKAIHTVTHGRTVTNFAHVPSVVRALEWVWIDLGAEKSKLESQIAALNLELEAERRKGGKTR